MANTPKKKNAGSSAKSGSKRRSAPPPPAYNAQARIIGGIVCLLLALCVLVTYFNVDAILLTFLANVLKGCMGYGYWLAAPALLYAGIVLVGHKGRPVKLRTTCTLLLPVLVGMVLHLLLSRGGYAFSLENIKPMWKDGQSLLCGGVVSGLLAVAMEALLSRVVSLILTILLTLAVLLAAGMVGLLIGWLIFERRRTKKRKEGFFGADAAASIDAIFRYMMDVLRARGMAAKNCPPADYVSYMDEDLREEYLTAARLWQEARFSGKPMEELQRRQVLRLKDEIWERTWHSASLKERLRLKYVEFL